MRPIPLGFLSLLALSLLSCQAARKGGGTGHWEEVLVEDSGWISGCAMTLRTAEGQVLVLVGPLSHDSFAFAPQDRWRVRLEPAPGAITACTLPGSPVRILEAKRLQSGRPAGTGGIKPSPRLCAWTIDAHSVPWMEQVIARLDPRLITRYRWLEGGAYLFQGDLGDFLFDCRGDLICQDLQGSGVCSRMPELDEAYVILVRNN